MLYKKGVEIIEIEECTFGFNQSIPAIKITVANNLTALLPRQKLFDIQIYKIIFYLLKRRRILVIK